MRGAAGAGLSFEPTSCYPAGSPPDREPRTRCTRTVAFLCGLVPVLAFAGEGPLVRQAALLTPIDDVSNVTLDALYIKLDGVDADDAWMERLFLSGRYRFSPRWEVAARLPLSFAIVDEGENEAMFGNPSLAATFRAFDDGRSVLQAGLTLWFPLLGKLSGSEPNLALISHLADIYEPGHYAPHTFTLRPDLRYRWRAHDLVVNAEVGLDLLLATSRGDVVEPWSGYGGKTVSVQRRKNTVGELHVAANMTIDRWDAVKPYLEVAVNHNLFVTDGRSTGGERVTELIELVETPVDPFTVDDEESSGRSERLVNVVTAVGVRTGSARIPVNVYVGVPVSEDLRGLVDVVIGLQVGVTL